MTTKTDTPQEGFVFDEKKHVYYLDGKPLSGVTSVLGVIAKPALIGWSARMAAEYVRENLTSLDDLEAVCEAAKSAHAKKRDKAADSGTDVHASVENYVRECILKHSGHPLATYDESLNQFVSWANDEGIRFIESEKKLYSRDLALAGTVDLVFEKDGKRYVGDIKTYKKLWDRTPMLQCAAYSIMHEEIDGKPFDGYCVIRMKDNDFEVRWSYDVDGDREAFLAALKLYRALQNWK